MILDIVLILFILASCFVGYRKGFTKILMRLISLVAALILAFSLKGVVIDGIDAQFNIKQNMNKTIITSINNSINNKEDNNFYTMIIEKTGAEKSVEELSNNIVSFILETAAFVVIFFLVLIISFVITTMLDLVFDLPILSSINGILGLVVGGLMAIVKVWVILSIFAMFGPLNESVQTYINSTQVAKILYYNNYILKILAPNLKF